jgi:hypothetical protein
MYVPKGLAVVLLIQESLCYPPTEDDIKILCIIFKEDVLSIWLSSGTKPSREVDCLSLPFIDLYVPALTMTPQQ